MNYRIREMDAAQRPRERLVEYGPGVLSDAELIAVLLRTGRPGHGAVAQAHDLLAAAGGLGEVARMEVAELTRRPGVGPAKAATLLAALELGRRVARAGLRNAERLDQPAQAGEFLVGLLRGERREIFGFLSLDARHRLLKHHELSRGTRNQAPVDPSDLFRAALLDHAVGVLVFHNHPSGDREPSRDDVELTRRLAASGESLGVTVHDHLIVAGGDWLSLRTARPDLFRG